LFHGRVQLQSLKRGKTLTDVPRLAPFDWDTVHSPALLSPRNVSEFDRQFGRRQNPWNFAQPMMMAPVIILRRFTRWNTVRYDRC
jgi:hypothetical protein